MTSNMNHVDEAKTPDGRDSNKSLWLKHLKSKKAAHLANENQAAAPISEHQPSTPPSAHGQVPVTTGPIAPEQQDVNRASPIPQQTRKTATTAAQAVDGSAGTEITKREFSFIEKAQLLKDDVINNVSLLQKMATYCQLVPLESPPMDESFLSLDGVMPPANLLSFAHAATKLQCRLCSTVPDAPTSENTFETISFLQSDMSLHVFTAEDHMEAWGFIVPPIDGGALLDVPTLMAQLRNHHVSFGIDQALLESMLEKENWLKLISIAKGQLPVDGVEGVVYEHFSREKEISLTENNDSTMDFKNLNWLKKIATGDIICDITQPTSAIHGSTVGGKRLQAKAARKLVIPAGENTIINEEGTALIATCDGQLNFKGKGFHVQTLLTIAGNVDTSIGNISAIGNVIIEGNVMEGFSVKATGNINVKGVVNGSNLEAGQDIVVVYGVKGNRKSVLCAGGSVKSQYLESCTVQAQGPVVASSIIDSTVICHDRVTVLNERGVIIGGSVTAKNLIEAKTIGNESYIRTKVVISTFNEQENAIEALCVEIAAKQEELSKLVDNVTFLKSMDKTSPEQAQLLNQLSLKLSTDNMAYGKKQRDLETLQNTPPPPTGRIVANRVYPATSVTIKKQSITIQRTANMARFSLVEGDLVTTSI